MPPLLDHLAAWKPFTVLVVGDFMLDRMIYGDAERLSADAPVPVLRVRRHEHRPGGAANVCLDLIAMKAHVKAFGVTGTDAHSDTLRTALAAEGVDTTGLVADPHRPTTVKENLVGLAQARHPQKMFRVDYESRDPLPPAINRALLERFDRELASADAVCIEDYDKGVCTPELCAAVISRARAAGKPVFVDPANIADYSRYRGATCITPNRSEAERATGLRTDEAAAADHNARLAQRLLGDLVLDAVVLTLDRHGALLLERSGSPLAVPTVAREVYDVTGAGDMFLAAVTAARCNGIDWPDAVRFANAAAGLEVEVFGVVPIPLERIHASLLEHSASTAGLGKLRTLDQLLIQIAAARREDRAIVFTNGCFDLIHPGHVSLLEQAAAAGRTSTGPVSGKAPLLVVGLNSDDSVRRLKGPTRPVNRELDRARVLSALAPVGAVILFSDDTPLSLIQAIRPDVLVKGADYTKDRVVGADFVESHGGRVVLVPLEDGKSTTATIKRLAAT